MTLDDFLSEQRTESNSDDEEVRPRVNKSSHERVRDFTSRAGLTITDGYDYLIGATLSDQGILEEILTLNNEYGGNLTTTQRELLDDLAQKYDELGCMPNREQINRDESMNGFPIYIIHLGKTDRIEELLEESYPEIVGTAEAGPH